ncbi:MFS transporter [Streptococcus entericus]|uniref:MFS transporter n=1 Tax=Streptococcus entericus TaxID=155680 RepID=UPI00037C66F3|nr:MFS transporter [Streptococcus entericus]
MLKLLKNKFIAGRLLAASWQNLGANIYNMVFVVYLATIYESKLLVGLADSIAYLPALLSLWLGFLADKTRQKTTYLIGLSAVQGLIFLLVAYLVGFKHYGVVIAVAFLNIFSDTISNYLQFLLKPIFKHNVPDEELVATNSLFQVVGLTVVLSSQPIGVWLLEVTNNNFSFIAFINAVTFFLSALTYWKIRKQLKHQVVFSDTKESVKVQLHKMYQTAVHVFQKSDGIAFLPMIVLLLIGNILSTSFLTLMNIQLLDVPIWQFSYAQSITAMGVVQIIGALLGGLTVNHLFKDLKLMTILTAQSLVTVFLALSGIVQLSSLIMLVGAFVLAFMGARSAPILTATLMRHVPDEQLGQVGAFISFLVTIAIPIGSIVFSFLGAYHLVLAWGVFFVLAAIRLFLAVRFTVRTTLPASDV